MSDHGTGTFALATEGLAKRYGRAVALDGLDLRVPAGVVYGFLGPNGAGKTTTIKMMAGLLQPTSGTIEIEGLDIRKDPLGAKAVTGFPPHSWFASLRSVAAVERYFLQRDWHANGTRRHARVWFRWSRGIPRCLGRRRFSEDWSRRTKHDTAVGDSQ